jgi:Domain of unknown function (DUF1877)
LWPVRIGPSYNPRVKTLRVFYRVRPDVLPHARENPSYCEDVLSGDEDGLLESFDVDQGWDAIHFCISGNRAYPDQGTIDDFTIFDWAITGRHDIHKGLALGHGPARFLGPDTVQQVHQALDALQEPEIRETFDPEAMDAAEVHPEIWGSTVMSDQERNDTWDYIWDHLNRLREFYRRAANDGNAVITWIIPVDD